MANEQQQTQPQVAIPLPKGKKNAVQIEGQKECSSDWMYLYDAFRSNVWTCIRNSDISNPGER